MFDALARNPRLLASLLTLFILSCSDCDPNKPDTKANRAGFTRHLGRQPGADVKGVYYYADELGADVSYQLRFEASRKTVEELIRSLELTDATPKPDPGNIPREDLSWWRPANKLKALPCYWKTNAKKDYYRMLWYDQSTGEVFYLEYSM